MLNVRRLLIQCRCGAQSFSCVTSSHKQFELLRPARTIQRHFSSNPPSDPPKTTPDSTDPSQPVILKTWWTIPNVLTVGRIVMTPLLGSCVVSGDYPFAFAGFCILGISDYLDGYIARQFNQRSIAGSYMDPLADKFLVGTLGVTMAYTGLLPIPLVTLILTRDVALISGAFVLRAAKNGFRWRTLAQIFDTSQDKFQMTPSLISKVNTFCQIGVIGMALLHAALGEASMLGSVLPAMHWLVAGTTLWSGLDYYRLRNRVLKSVD